MAAGIIGGAVGSIIPGLGTTVGGVAGSLAGGFVYDQTVGRVLKPLEEQVGQMQAYGDLMRGYSPQLLPGQFTAGRRGTSSQQEMEFGREMFKFAMNDLGLSQQDVYKISQGAMSADLIGQTGDMKKVRESLKTLIDNTKETAKVMHMSFEDSMEFMTDLRSMGFDVTGTKYAGEVHNIRAASMSAGMTTGQMMNIMRGGAQAFRGTGFGMARGAQHSQLGAQMGITARRSGSIGEQLYQEIGGAEGAGNLAAMAARRYMESSLGTMMASAQAGGVGSANVAGMSIGQQFGQVGQMAGDPNMLLRLATQKGKILRDRDPRMVQGEMYAQFRRIAEGLQGPGQEIDDLMGAVVQNQLGFNEDQAEAWLKMARELPKTLRQELVQAQHQRNQKIRDMAAEQRDIFGRVKRNIQRKMEPISGAAADAGASIEDWTEQQVKRVESWYYQTQDVAVTGDDVNLEAREQLYASDTARRGTRAMISGDAKKTRLELTARLRKSDLNKLSSLADELKNTSDPLDRIVLGGEMTKIAFGKGASAQDIAGLGRMYGVDLAGMVAQDPSITARMQAERKSNIAAGAAVGSILNPFLGTMVGAELGKMRGVTGRTSEDEEQRAAAEKQIKRFQTLTGVTDRTKAITMMRSKGEKSEAVQQAIGILADVKDVDSALSARQKIALLVTEAKDDDTRQALESILDRAQDQVERHSDPLTFEAKRELSMMTLGGKDETMGMGVRIARSYKAGAGAFEGQSRKMAQEAELAESFNVISGRLSFAGIDIKGLTDTMHSPDSGLMGIKAVADAIRNKKLTKDEVEAAEKDPRKKAMMDKFKASQALLKSAKQGGSAFTRALGRFGGGLDPEVRKKLAGYAKDDIITDEEMEQIEGEVAVGGFGGFGSGSKDGDVSTRTISPAVSEKANKQMVEFANVVQQIAHTAKDTALMIKNKK